ncbi:hypothetical protein QDY63_11135 [Pseudomonas brenneri]|uniref:hypothetical protein n=1 Tax=Pseudomonas brenneri TaxID=129817 RepID=UPI0025A12945|nr:hypothetical protein [Pseudomonas brenneri]WJM93398.1 hypothetical protein QDY63_11135 [Pseudomonas brenneri]
MNIPKGFKLVPVKPTDDMVIAFAETWYSKRQAYDDPDMDDAYRDMLTAAPTPPQPIFDEASERDRFDAEYEKICCRTGITIREIAWRMWQSRAKAGEDE